MSESLFQKEGEFLAEGYSSVIGVDEAGRGPLAGPVVASATMVRNFQLPISKVQISDIKLWELIRDSKALSEGQREKLFGFIHEHFFVGVGFCDHRTIDRINILEATFLAMKKAVSELIRKTSSQRSPQRGEGDEGKTIILVDGNKIIPNFSMEQKAIVNGDNLVKSIAAASIIAKVTRDRIMQEMHEKYPQYGFAKHKGYGTKQHVEAISQCGPCEIHRRSFEPIATLVKTKK